MILVTGAHGFIGGYVVDNLVRRGQKVLAFDRHVHLAEDRESVVNFLGDVRDENAVDEAAIRCEGVIHLAGVLGTTETVDRPDAAMETNIMGSLNVFRACRRHHLKGVYISVGNFWMNNPYSISKTTAERLAWMANREWGTKIAVVRALNAIGPRQKPQPVRKIAPSLILAALQGRPVPVYGDGGQVMDVIHAADVAEVLVRALLVEHRNYIYDPITELDTPPRFEAGTGRPTTVLEIATAVIAAVGHGTVEHLPMRKGEPEGSVVLANTETLRPLFNGELPSFVPMETAIAETVAFYRRSEPWNLKLPAQ